LEIQKFFSANRGEARERIQTVYPEPYERQPLGDVEYRAFLNMWLCRFVFCGKANEPTLNHMTMASHLASGNRLPLGKFLLGSVYHMLHQNVTQMYTSQRITCVNDPW
jgi:hypothetical protein